MVTDQERAAAEERLAGFLGLPYGKKRDVDGSWYNVGPRWTTKKAEALDLMLEHTLGYYETRAGTTDHAIVVPSAMGNPKGTVAVYLRDHPGGKSVAFAYAMVLAVTAKLEHEAQLRREACTKGRRAAQPATAALA